MRTLLFLALTLLLFSCNKDDLIVDGNVPPPDNTVEDYIINNYIGKTYISVLGREPLDAEKSAAFTQLKNDGYDEEARKTYLNNLFEDEDYFGKIYDIARIELLNGVDTNEYYSQVFIYNLLLMDSNQMAFWPFYESQIVRAQNLREMAGKLGDPGFSIADMYSTFVNNPIYDEINMGTENFVVSLYQNFLFRYPTVAEIGSGSLMVDGFESTLFLELGEDKDDFIDIFFASDAYYEGQVKFLFNRYLFKDPDSEEMSFYADLYKSSNYQELQKAILSRIDYAGLL